MLKSGKKPPPPPARKAFAKRLKAHRIAKGYETAKKLSDELGVELNTYTRWERAETEPDISTITRIFATLGITANDLFSPGSPKKQTRAQLRRVG